jgi:hypothetical protein
VAEHGTAEPIGQVPHVTRSEPLSLIPLNDLEEWQWLMQDQVAGDLRLVRLGAETPTFLRERLG